MIILANLMNAIAVVLNMICNFFVLVIFLGVIISWVNADPYNPIVRFINSMTEPLLRPIRRKIPPLGGRIDISPIILLLAVYFLQAFLVGSLQSYAHTFRLEAIGGGRTLVP